MFRNALLIAGKQIAGSQHGRPVATPQAPALRALSATSHLSDQENRHPDDRLQATAAGRGPPFKLADSPKPSLAASRH